MGVSVQVVAGVLEGIVASEEGGDFAEARALSVAEAVPQLARACKVCLILMTVCSALMTVCLALMTACPTMMPVYLTTIPV
jgi:hypothetical protein